MAIYVATVKTYEESDFFAAYDSNAGRMFTPTFSRREELDAHIFVCYYERIARYSYTDDIQGQMKVSIDLRDWLNEIAPLSGPFYSTQTRKLPQAWVEKLWVILWPDNDEPERTPDVSAEDLIQLFSEGRGTEADFILDEFIEWQTAQTLAKATK